MYVFIRLNMTNYFLVFKLGMREWRIGRIEKRASLAMSPPLPNNTHESKSRIIIVPKNGSYFPLVSII
jgi:hypothetical protein